MPLQNKISFKKNILFWKNTMKNPSSFHNTDYGDNRNWH